MEIADILAPLGVFQKIKATNRISITLIKSKRDRIRKISDI